jgi:hypothetical protein
MRMETDPVSETLSSLAYFSILDDGETPKNLVITNRFQSVNCVVIHLFNFTYYVDKESNYIRGEAAILPVLFDINLCYGFCKIHTNVRNMPL